MLDQPHLIHSTDDPPLPPGSQCAGVPTRRSCGSGSIPWPALGLCSSRPKLRKSAGVESVEGPVGCRSSIAAELERITRVSISRSAVDLLYRERASGRLCPRRARPSRQTTSRTLALCWTSFSQRLRRRRQSPPDSGQIPVTRLECIRESIACRRS